jgi:hypothetical protein
VSCLGAKYRPAPASCEGSMRSPVPSKAPRGGSCSSVVSAHAGPSGVVLQSGLASQLEDCLTRVGSFLERAVAALSRLSLVSAMLQTTPMLCPLAEVAASSAEDGGVELYGCFSPRVGNTRPRCLFRLPLRVRPSPKYWIRYCISCLSFGG